MPVPEDWYSQFEQEVHRLKSNPTAEESIGDNPFPKFFLTERSDSWNGFIGWADELEGSWCFRGQRESEWLLHTSLDRLVRREYANTDPSGFRSKGHYHLNRESEQQELIFRFQQEAHTHIKNLPASEDLGSWLALMQHHGAPTRLLDWTESPHVAAYFAVEERSESDPKKSAVWAIDLNWLETAASTFFPMQGANSLLMDATGRAHWVNSILNKQALAIIRVNPLRTDERMAAQQGVLLCKLFHEATFNQILMRMMIHAGLPKRPVVRKLEIDANQRVGLLTKLKSMNIHRASLFPGLDGLAQSLRFGLEIKDS